MADWQLNYFATSAPLAVGNLVVAGTGGGEHGARGFLAAFDQATGKEVWRFWTVPMPGEPGSETWKGKGIEHGGAPTWFTGTYDAQTDTVYWPTGNPSAEYNGDDRAGDNLYSDCILALDAKTGKLKWHYQTTPHDLWDWDATETPVVVDADVGGPAAQAAAAGQSQRLLLRLRPDRRQAAAGQAVRPQPDLGQRHRRGRPSRQDCRIRSPAPRAPRVCPSQDGATNWFSPSYNPGDRTVLRADLRKVQRLHQARSGRMDGRARSIWAARSSAAPDEKPQRILKAIDIQTGKIAWELPQPGPAESWGGTLSTVDRPGDFRRGRRRADGRRRGDRQAAVELPDQSDLEGVADDLPVRRQAVRRRGRRPEHHRLRNSVAHTSMKRTSIFAILFAILFRSHARRPDAGQQARAPGVVPRPGLRPVHPLERGQPARRRDQPLAGRARPRITPGASSTSCPRPSTRASSIRRIGPRWRNSPA